jgi:RNA polymerase-binding transcription factor DksA
VLSLPQKTFEKIKNILVRQQKELEQELKSIEKNDIVGDGALAESSEPGTDSWMADVHGRAVTLKNSAQLVLMRTKKALAKIKTGSYGKCENCGKSIEVERLEAIPTATFCLSCSKKLAKKS